MMKKSQRKIELVLDLIFLIVIACCLLLMQKQAHSEDRRDLPPIQRGLLSRYDQMRMAQAQSLAPPVVTRITVEDSIGEREHYLIRADRESPSPLIIKFSPLKYLSYTQGKIKLYEIEDGAEELFDKFFG